MVCHLSHIETLNSYVPTSAKIKYHTMCVLIMIMIMIKIPVMAQPAYQISTIYYCSIDNSTCSEINNHVSLSLPVSLVGHINNQDLLLFDGSWSHYLNPLATSVEPLLEFCFSVCCLWDLALVTILSPRMIISVSPLAH